MSLLSVVEKWPSWLTTTLFFVIATAGIVTRFLLYTKLGTLILALAFYWWAENYTSIDPLTAPQLLMWFDQLPGEYKVSVGGALVTVFGFIVAFHTATLNWQNQFRTKLAADAAGEIEQFSATTLRNIHTIEYFVNYLVKTVNRIQTEGNVPSVQFDVQYSQELANEFVGARAMIGQQSVEVHNLIGRNFNILASHSMHDSMDRISNAVGSVSEAMWIRIPIIAPDDPLPLQSFLNQVNIADCTALIAKSEKAQTVISACSGEVRGRLLSPAIGFNWRMYLTLVSRLSKFKQAFEEFYNLARKK